MADDLELLVDGRRYGGWKAIEVRRALDAVAGAFAVELTERWADQSLPWQIPPGAACKVLLDGSVVITGHVDSVSVSYDATSHAVRIAGRDSTGDLVDCSAMNTPDQWDNIGLLRLAQVLAEPFGITNVTADADLGDAFSVVKLEHGETAWEALERHARQRGVLCLSDGQGGLLLTTPGSRRAEVSLVHGDNILAASGTLDWADRFSAYTVKGQTQGSDEWDAAASAHAHGEATDPAVTRYRPLLVVAEAIATNASAKRRAAWESTVRAGRSAKATVTVQGWRQRPGGALWDTNMLVQVRAPWLQLEGTMMVSGVAFRRSDQGTTTVLELTSPSAYQPDTEPRKKQRGGEDDQWGAW